MKLFSVVLPSPTLLLFVSLLLARLAYAALPGQRADSLRQCLSGSLPDTDRVRVLSQFTKELGLWPAGPAPGPEALRRAARGAAAQRHGRQLLFVGRPAGATRYFQQALVRAEKVPQQGRLLTAALLGLG